MERIFHVLGFAMLAVVICMIIVNAVHDPLMARRQAFAEQMARIPLTPALPETEKLDSARLRMAVAAKPKLWDALVEEKKAPPPKPHPPNLIALLKGVTVTRQSIGDKVKIRLPKNKKGVWVAKGEEIINGCVLKDFDKFNATVSFYWAVEDRELTVELVRN